MESKMIIDGSKALLDLPSSVQSFLVMLMVFTIVMLVGVVLKMRKQIATNNLSEKAELLKTFQTYMEQATKRDELQNNAIFSIIKDKLQYLCAAAEKEGWVDSKQFEAITNMYEAYREMGGNSFIVGMYERVRKLPHNKQ